MAMLLQLQDMIQSASSSQEWLNGALSLQRLGPVLFDTTGPICFEGDVAELLTQSVGYSLEIDPELFYMKQLHLSISESLVLYVCFGISFLCFVYSSFLLLESLIHFGLNRFQRKLQMWQRFMSTKHQRL